MQRSYHLAIAAGIATLGATTRADEPLAGFTTQTVYTSTTPARPPATATLSTGDFVAFDGLTVELYSDSGTFIDVLATLPSAVFPSFVAIDPSETYCVIGENANGDLFTVDLLQGGLTPLVNLSFNYDGAFEAPGSLLVSAATCGFDCGNQLYRVDVASRTADRIGVVPGASGPLAVTPAGDLVYATVSGSFPAPPESSDVLRWSAARIAPGMPDVTTAQASVLASGFDGASSVAVDALTGEVYLAETNFGLGVNDVRLVRGTPNASPVLLEGTTAGQSFAHLEFVAGVSPASFHAFQPRSGGSLLYNTADFFSVATHGRITPLRAVTFYSGTGTSGPGPYELNLTSAAPGGLAYVLYGPASLAPAQELAFYLAGPGFSIFLGLDFATMALDPTPLTIGAGGSASRTYVNPGGLEGTLAAQVVFFDQGLNLVGSSSVAFN